MTTINDIITYINSMDPVGREAVLMDLKNIHDIHKLWIYDPDEFIKKYSLRALYDMEDDFESKLKNLTGCKTVPIWQIIYCEMFGKY